MGAAWIDQEDWDYIRSLVQNIKVTNGDLKYWGRGKHAGINIICSAQSEAAAAAGYEGPFAVSKKDASTVTIAAGFLILGLSKVDFSETDLTITVAGSVYLEVSWSGSAWTVTEKNAATLPTQTDSKYYLPLASVAFADSTVGAITQQQYGFIQGAGRVF